MTQKVKYFFTNKLKDKNSKANTKNAIDPSHLKVY